MATIRPRSVGATGVRVYWAERQRVARMGRVRRALYWLVRPLAVGPLWRIARRWWAL